MEHQSHNQPPKEWYQTELGVAALLVLFFPAGIYLMWKYADWSSRAKWIITGVFAGLILLGGMVSSQTDNAGDTIEPTPSARSTATATPTLTPTPELKAEPPKDTLPQEPKARIEAIIKKQGDFEVTFTGAPEDKPDQPPAPYAVVANVKDFTEWQDKCTQAKDKAFHIQRTLYTDPVATANVARVLVNLRPALSVSVGVDRGRAYAEIWKSGTTAFFDAAQKGGVSRDNEESVPMQARTWVEEGTECK